MELAGRIWAYGLLLEQKIKLPVNEMGSQGFGVLATYLVLLIDFGVFSVGSSVYDQY